LLAFVIPLAGRLSKKPRRRSGGRRHRVAGDELRNDPTHEWKQKTFHYKSSHKDPSTLALGLVGADDATNRFFPRQKSVGNGGRKRRYGSTWTGMPRPKRHWGPALRGPSRGKPATGRKGNDGRHSVSDGSETQHRDRSLVESSQGSNWKLCFRPETLVPDVFPLLSGVPVLWKQRRMEIKSRGGGALWFEGERFYPPGLKKLRGSSAIGLEARGIAIASVFEKNSGQSGTRS